MKDLARTVGSMPIQRAAKTRMKCPLENTITSPWARGLVAETLSELQETMGWLKGFGSKAAGYKIS